MNKSPKNIFVLWFCLFYTLAGKAQVEQSLEQSEAAITMQQQLHHFKAWQIEPQALAQQINQLYLKDERLSLHYLETHQSAAATHLSYQVHFKDVPVYLATATATVYGNSKIRLFLPQFSPVLNMAAANEIVAKNIAPSALKKGISQAFYLPTAEGLILAEQQNWRVDTGVYIISYATKNKILLIEDERKFKADTTINAQVFKPDPLTSANVFYGGTFQDFNDADYPEINAELQTVQFKASFEQGIFILKSDDFVIVDDYDPVTTIAAANQANFHYNRNQDQFEDVNAFYHLSLFQNYINALGYNLPGIQLKVDAHGYNIDQSSYSGRFLNLRFGDGGVDDAEDADVIIHEFFHAVIDGASAFFSGSLERKTLDEALCDFIAHSHSKSQSPNQVDKIFNWDGHNRYWPGRSAVSQKNYNDLNFNGIYDHTDLMVSCLRELETDIGRDQTNALVLESIYSLTSNTTFRQFAYTMLLSDTLLHSAVNTHAIHRAFKRRQVLPAEISLTENAALPTVALYNSLGFANGQAVTIIASDKLKNIAVYNVNGFLVFKSALLNSKEYKLRAQSNWSPGLYILTVSTEKGSQKTFKLIRN
jgi:hypothetical protein